MSIEVPISSMPVPMRDGAIDPSLRGVVFVGGSFDPPHVAHVKLPTQVRDFIETKLGHGWQLVMVPAARSPHKDNAPRATDEQRLAMLDLALASTPRSGVWRDELDRAANSPGPSYTIDTLKRARQWLDAHQGQRVQLVWVIGADQLLKFHTWRDPLGIIELARVPVMFRNTGLTREQVLHAITATGFWTGPQLEQWVNSFVPGETIDASSTRVREMLAKGDAAVSELLAPQVEKYIREHRLYQAPVR